MTVDFFHINNSRNMGDTMCAPYHYFDFGKDTRVNDVRKFPEHSRDVAIFGGGAVAGIMRQTQAVQKSHAKKVITWGVGRSIRGVFRGYPAYPGGVHLQGVRDYSLDLPKNFFYVPCASCMHEAFDRSYVIERNVVGFINAAKPAQFVGVDLQIDNRRPMAEIIAVLGSANIVVTNSYHGAYWAMLLGRRVIIAGAYSSKFRMFKHQPALTESLDWRAQLPKAVAYSGVLEECRDINRAYYHRVMEFING